MTVTAAQAQLETAVVHFKQALGEKYTRYAGDSPISMLTFAFGQSGIPVSPGSLVTSDLEGIGAVRLYHEKLQPHHIDCAIANAMVQLPIPDWYPFAIRMIVQEHVPATLDAGEIKKLSDWVKSGQMLIVKKTYDEDMIASEKLPTKGSADWGTW